MYTYKVEPLKASVGEPPYLNLEPMHGFNLGAAIVQHSSDVRILGIVDDLLAENLVAATEKDVVLQAGMNGVVLDIKANALPVADALNVIGIYAGDPAVKIAELVVLQGPDCRGFRLTLLAGSTDAALTNIKITSPVAGTVAGLQAASKAAVPVASITAQIINTQIVDLQSKPVFVMAAV